VFFAQIINVFSILPPNLQYDLFRYSNSIVALITKLLANQHNTKKFILIFRYLVSMSIIVIKILLAKKLKILNYSNLINYLTEIYE